MISESGWRLLMTVGVAWVLAATPAGAQVLGAGGLPAWLP